MCRDGVGVITSALHAEGRGFDSHSLYDMYMLRMCNNFYFFQSFAALRFRVHIYQKGQLPTR